MKESEKLWLINGADKMRTSTNAVTHKIILYRKDPGQIPVITPYLVGQKTYENIFQSIHELNRAQHAHPIVKRNDGRRTKRKR